MTTEEVIKEINQQAKELEALGRRGLPIKVGNLAKCHFQDNFRQGGFVNNGLQPWQKSKRQSGKGTDASRSPLMSGRKHLFSSVRYTPSDNRVKIHNNVPYAPIHNWGGTIPITPRMKGYAWRRFFTETGITDNDTPKEKKAKIEKASQSTLMWRNLALSKKTHIKMPQRQFIGESKELNEKVSRLVETEISKIMHK